LNSGGVTVTGGIEGDGALASSRALDDALMKAEEKMELGSSNANTRQPLSELNVLSPTPMSASSSNYSPLTSPPKITAQHDSEGDNDQNNTHLLQELHRIQGMLGTVMKQKKRKGGGGHKSPQRDADVERLQEALVVSTMRKADSSFLQSQLNMKEGILKEVTVLLEALEKRQLELESENKQLKEDLAEATNMIEKANAANKLLNKRLAEKDVQLSEKKCIVFSEHLKTRGIPAPGPTADTILYSSYPPAPSIYGDLAATSEIPPLPVEKGHLILSSDEST